MYGSGISEAKRRLSSVLSGRCGKRRCCGCRGATTNIVLYDGATGKEKYTLPSHQILTNNDGMIAVRENTIVTLGQDQENLLNYDALTGKQSGATQVEALENGIGFLTTDENGTYLYCDEKRNFCLSGERKHRRADL